MKQLNIFTYFLVFFCGTGCINGSDQSYFLWKDSKGNLIDIGKKQIRGERWRRNMYKWMHSSLIKSIENEIEEGDTETPKISKSQLNISTSPPRFQRENTDKFEDEFFLWQDSEGNPFRFGLKQVNESTKIISTESGKLDFARIKDKRTSSPVWQNPLFYEDNNEISNDSSISAIGESSNVREIIKSKFGAIFNFLYPQETPSNDLNNNNNNLVFLFQRPNVPLNQMEMRKSDSGSHFSNMTYTVKHFANNSTNSNRNEIVDSLPYSKRGIVTDLNLSRHNKSSKFISRDVAIQQGLTQSKYDGLEFIENLQEELD